MLRAVPGSSQEFPNFVYIVLGATHPDLVREQGEALPAQPGAAGARTWASSKNVIFYNRFVELDELTEFIRAADIYVTPYLNPAQITSGTLAYAFGCGKAVVSTPYWHAEELLADGRGVLVPFADSRGPRAGDLRAAARRAAARHAMRRQAYRLGREMIWSHVAPTSTWSRSSEARRSRAGSAVQAAGGPDPRRAAGELPDWRLDHLSRMTDSTGHVPARHLHHPQLRRGVLHRRQRPRPAADGAPGGDWATTRPRCRLRHDLRGVPPGGLRPRPEAVPQLPELRPPLAARRSARTTATAGRSGAWRLRRPVAAARPAGLGRGALRARAAAPSWRRPRPGPGRFGLLGIHEYLRRFSGDRAAGQIRDALTSACSIALRADRHARLALVRGDPQLRQRPAAARPDRQRPRSSGDAAGPGDRPAQRWAGWSRVQTAQAATSGRSAATASTARGGPARRFDQQPIEARRDGLRLPGGLPGHRGPLLDERGPLAPSSGSSAATTWARSCTTRAPAAAATASRTTASTGTRAPNRPSRSSSRSRR